MALNWPGLRILDHPPASGSRREMGDGSDQRSFRAKNTRSELHDEIALRPDRAEKLVDGEAEFIDALVALSDDERAGLWLFAWSSRASGRQHRGQVLAGPRT